MKEHEEKANAPKMPRMAAMTAATIFKTMTIKSLFMTVKLKKIIKGTATAEIVMQAEVGGKQGAKGMDAETVTADKG